MAITEPLETNVGKSNGPIPIETEASRILLPIISPIASSCCPFLMAAMVTDNSGRLVPIAAIKKPTMNSEILKIRVISSIELMTIYVPIATPTNPRISIIKFETFRLGKRGHENSFSVTFFMIRIKRTQKVIKKNPSDCEMNPSSIKKKTRISARRVDAPMAKTSFLFIANCLWNNAMIPNTSVNWAKVDPREVPIVIFPCH